MGKTRCLGERPEHAAVGMDSSSPSLLAAAAYAACAAPFFGRCAAGVDVSLTRCVGGSLGRCCVALTVQRCSGRWLALRCKRVPLAVKEASFSQVFQLCSLLSHKYGP